MPLLRKQTFVKEKPPPNLKSDDEVFHCKITNEIFSDYEKFFERIILCNSLVWTCSVTGKPGLTYQEALECEAKGRKQIAAFPSYLQRPILYLAHLTYRTRIDEMNDDVFQFTKNRYYVNEVVEVQHDDQKKMCKVVKVIAPSQGKKLFENGATSDKDSDSVIVLDSTDGSDEEDDKPLSTLKKNDDSKSNHGPDADKLQYVVQEIKEPNIYIVEAYQVSRKKGLYTRDKSKLFLKNHCTTEKQNIWVVRERYVRKHLLNEISWSDYFDGPVPVFAKTKVNKTKKTLSNKSSKGSSQVIDLTDEDVIIKQAKKQHKEMKKMEKEIKKIKKEQRKEDKKQKKKEAKKIEKQQQREMNEKQEKLLKQKEEQKPKEETFEEKFAKLTPEEKAAYRENIRLEKLAERTAKLEELKRIKEEEKNRKKEERDKEREKQKEEKRIKEEYMKEWNKPREDMECDDLKPIPKAIPINCRVPTELFGDAMMVVEYLHCFQSLFDIEDEFPDGINLDFLGRALQETDIKGSFCDILRFLLTAIFQLQEEEEEYDEEEVNEVKSAGAEYEDKSFKELIKQATLDAQIPLKAFGSSLSKMEMDGFTITEIVRLHFLSSGARASESNNRFRYQQRGGFTSADDAGLEFKRHEPDILKSLREMNVFDLSTGEKLKILTALIQQILTYVACRDVIEENCDKLRQTRTDLKMHQWAEQRREREEATFWYKKRIEDRNKEKELKKKEKEEQLRKEEQLKTGENIADTSTEQAKSNEETGENEQKEDLNATDSKDSSPNEKKKSDKATKGNSTLKGRQSARQKEKEQNEKIIDLDNIDWEKITPEDKELMRERFEEKELELMEEVQENEHNSAIHPLGRDRTFRRYWVFRSVPGIFVEDQEEYITDDFLNPVEQVLNQSNLPYQSNTNTPVKNEKSEEKNTSSDKENDSFDAGKQITNGQAVPLDSSSNSPVLQEQKPKILQENNQSSTEVLVGVPDDKSMEVDEDNQETDKPFEITYETVLEQITNRNNDRWAFYSTPLELDTLINSLNPRGFREGHLRQALVDHKKKIVQSLENCPVDILNISDEMAADTNVKFQQIKSRNRKIQGQVKGASASEFLELNLREQLLDFEERIFVGGLGALKIADRKHWKDAIEFGNYDPQCEELKWSDQSVSVTARFSKGQENGNLDVSLSQQSMDGEVRLVVRDLSCALLQLQQMVEPKFLKPPLGENEEIKKEKMKEALELAFKGLTPRKIKAKVWEKDSKKKKKDNEENIESDDDSDEEEKENSSISTVKKTPLERWQESVMGCSSLSQIFLHFTVLENSVTWDKSALNARCKICRRKGDDEKMLLCDGCDNGYHMYCLKPPMKKLPQGDWYCHACKPKDIAATPRKRRKSTFVEEDKEEETEETEDDETEDDDEDSSDDSSDDSDESDSDDNESEETEEEEAVQQPAKIKFLKGFTKGRQSKADSEKGSSKGGSARSSRSNTPTPTQGNSRASKGRTSLEKSIQIKNVSAKAGGEKRKGGRHSIETDQPSRKSIKKGDETVKNSGKGNARLSLDNSSNSRGKRKLLDEDNDQASTSKKLVSKSRCNEKVNVMKLCEDLVNEMTKRDESWPFHKPVSKKEAPDYYDIIKYPMDFSTIRTKINNVQYSHPSSLLEDQRAIFSNCHAYNMPTAPEFQAASKLSRYFEKRCKELKLDVLCKSLPQATLQTTPKKSSPKIANGPSPSTRRATRKK